MSKVLKVAAVVAGIALAIPSGGTSLLAVGLGVSSLAATAIVVGLTLASSLLAPKPKAPKTSPADRDRLFASIDPSTPRKIVYGHTAMATDIRDQEYTGTDDEYFHRFMVVASHKVNSIEEIWFDDKLAWTVGGGVQGDYVGYLEVTPILEGSADNAINISARMGSTRRYTGLAYVHFRYKLTGNSSKTSSPFSQSIPTRVTIIGNGMAVYDPRKDSTRGGFGSHRIDDQSTWTWDDKGARNGALQWLNYLIGYRIDGKLAVGKGIPAARIDVGSFATAANACDETITLAGGGTEPRYRTDGIFSEADPMELVVNQFKSSMNAISDDAGGQIRAIVLVNDLGSPVADFDANDVLGAIDWKPGTDLSDRFNIVKGSHTDPSTTSLYQSVDYPEQFLASTDDIDRTFTVDFPLVQSVTQCQRLAKQRLQRAQYGGILSFTGQTTFWKVLKNDIVRFTFPPLGMTDKLFRVVDIAAQQDGVVPVVLREEDASIYAWDEDETAALQLAPPDTYDYQKNPLYERLGDVRRITHASPTIPGFPEFAIDGTGDRHVDLEGRRYVQLSYDDAQLVIDGIPITIDGQPVYMGWRRIDPVVKIGGVGGLIVQNSSGDNQVDSDLLNNLRRQVVATAEIQLQADTEGALQSTIPFDIQVKALIGNDDVSAETSFAATFPPGITGTINNDSGDADRGDINISALVSGGNIVVTATFADGLKESVQIRVTVVTGQQPITGGTGATMIEDRTWLNISSTDFVQITDQPLVLNSDGSGDLRFSFSASFEGVAGLNVEVVARYRTEGSGGAWSDAGTSAVGSATAYEPEFGITLPGYISKAQFTQAMGANDSPYEVALFGKRIAGSGSAAFSNSNSLFLVKQ